jgi:cell division protein ZipA
VALFRWILLFFGILVIAGVFAYSRGWITLRLPKRKRKTDDDADRPGEIEGETESESEPEPEPPSAKAPEITSESMVVTVRVMPQPESRFPAEQLILALRHAGLMHGKYGIFHCLDDSGENRIRYSVASLVEPGSFDLTKLKDSDYNGISIFMILPAAEDGVVLFDDMMQTARKVAKEIDGRMVDERGGALSVQRERYMREEVIEFLRQHRRSQTQSMQQGTENYFNDRDD